MLCNHVQTVIQDLMTKAAEERRSRRRQERLLQDQLTQQVFRRELVRGHVLLLLWLHKGQTRGHRNTYSPRLTLILAALMMGREGR